MSFTTKILESGWVQVLFNDVPAYEYMKIAHGWLLWRPSGEHGSASSLLLIQDPHHNQPPLPEELKLWSASASPSSRVPPQMAKPRIDQE